MMQKWVRGLGTTFVVLLAIVAGIYTYFRGTFWAKASAEKVMQTSLHREFSNLKFHQMGRVWYNFKTTSYGVDITFDKLPTIKYDFELHHGKLVNEGSNTLHAPVPVPYSTTWINQPVSATPSPRPGVSVTGLSTGIGAVSKNDLSFDRQKYSFKATISNKTNQTVYVTSVNVQLPATLKSHVISGSQTISVNKTLKANAYTEVSGYFILNTKGMTKRQIVNLGSIQGFTVYVK